MVAIHNYDTTSFIYVKVPALVDKWPTSAKLCINFSR